MITLVRLDPGPWAEVAAHAAREQPEEACGLLVGHANGDVVRVTRIVPCPNLAEPAERGRRFQIDPRILLQVQRTLRGTPEALLGFYHSHPDGEAAPSARDRFYIALWPETVWLIIPVREPILIGEARAWWLDGGAVWTPSVGEAGLELPSPRELVVVVGG